MPLAVTYFGNEVGQTFVRQVDAAYCDRVAQVYRDAGCWTWADDWSWFETETFCLAPTEQVATAGQAALMPLNAFNIDPVSLT